MKPGSVDLMNQQRGHNFMLTMLRLAKERKELRIVDDQVGAPTWCRSLAEITAQIMAQIHAPEALENYEKLSGIYHLTSSGCVSWYSFAVEILNLAKMQPMPNLIPISSREYPTPAIRPKNSELSNEKLTGTFGLAAGGWMDNLCLCLSEIVE